MNKLDMVQCENVDGGLLRELSSIASQVSARLLSYRRHILQLEAEVDRLEAGLGKATEADKPATAPVPTWTPPVSLPDGIYLWKSTRLEKAEIDEDGRKSTWADWSPGESYKDWTPPPRAGEWQVKSGRAACLVPHEESPQ